MDMHATYTFPTRYYTDELHNSTDIWDEIQFANVISPRGNITRAWILEQFDGIEQEGMLDIEVVEFDNLDKKFRELLAGAKIPFERVHFAFDGYDADRTVFYPDGTTASEKLNESLEPCIPAAEFEHFFSENSKVVSSYRLTADAFFEVFNEHTLKFKRRANYFINNDFVFIEQDKRQSIEDVLAQFDEGNLTQEEAFNKIAEIKKEGEAIEQQLFGTGS